MEQIILFLDVFEMLVLDETLLLAYDLLSFTLNKRRNVMKTEYVVIWAHCRICSETMYDVTWSNYLSRHSYNRFNFLSILSLFFNLNFLPVLKKDEEALDLISYSMEG